MLFQLVYDQIKLPPIILKPIDIPFYGFSSYSVWPNGGVELFVTVGSHPTQAIMSTNFLMMDTLRVYNAIIRRLTLNALRVVAFIFHLALKFLTPVGIGVVHGNQIETCHCYALALKGQPNTR